MGMQLVFRVHAVRRMFERSISVEDIRQVLLTGSDIEDYPTDYPYPSRLILAWIGGRPIHVVAAQQSGTSTEIIITVYEPSPAKWKPDFRSRL